MRSHLSPHKEDINCQNNQDLPGFAKKGPSLISGVTVPSERDEIKLKNSVLVQDKEGLNEPTDGLEEVGNDHDPESPSNFVM
ncbi:unnamed protein product [Alternaria alternata]